MPNFTACMDTSDTADKATAWTGNMYKDYTVQADNIIRRKPDTITVHTRLVGGDLPGAQEVRIEALREPARFVGEAASQGQEWIVVLGFKDHPSEIDTDLERGDKFWHKNVTYEVHTIKVGASTLPGHMEAYCVAVH